MRKRKRPCILPVHGETRVKEWRLGDFSRDLAGFTVTIVRGEIVVEGSRIPSASFFSLDQKRLIISDSARVLAIEDIVMFVFDAGVAAGRDNPLGQFNSME